EERPAADLVDGQLIVGLEYSEESQVRVAQIPELLEMMRAHVDHGIRKPADASDDPIMKLLRLSGSHLAARLLLTLACHGATQSRTNPIQRPKPMMAHHKPREMNPARRAAGGGG